MRALALCICAIFIPLGAYGLPNEVSYTIEAELDPTRNAIMGIAVIELTNRTGQELKELHFHVYPNAFRRGSSSRYQQELQRIAGVSDLDIIYADPKDDASMEITSITSEGKLLEFTMEETLLTVRLSKPLQDGRSIRLAIEFIYDLMEVSLEARMAFSFAVRSGHREGVYTIALWYPKLAVYDERGWHLQPYSYLGEFYGDFAHYQVELTVPSSFEVGATGALESQWLEVGETVKKTLRFVAERVHDFAWVASSRYLVEELEWEGITLRALYLTMPDLAERALEALKFFSEQFGPYAYPVFTVAQVEAGGGMEYPAIVMIGQGTDREIAHEVAHQWWYAAVGNDEYNEAWLDEGFTTFSEERYLIEKLGYAEEFVRSSLRFREPGEVVLQPASEYPSLSVYAAAVYTKASGILWMLRGLLGREVFDELLREYYERFRYQNVTTDDFIALTEEISGLELDWFFDQWLRTTKTIDFSVEDVSSTPTADGGYEHEITVRREGEAVMPVAIRLSQADGKTQELWWEGLEDMKGFTVEGSAPLKQVMIDPERIVLEEDRGDNLWVANSNQAGLPTGLQLGVIAALLLLILARSRSAVR
jgi:hypothetical protein